MDKKQIAHDLALIVVENMLEDVDDGYSVKEYSNQAVSIYESAKEIILKQLDKEQ